MAPSIDRTSTKTPHLVETALVGPVYKDIPALVSDRISQLYAEEERRDRIARTDVMIGRARTQLQ